MNIERTENLDKRKVYELIGAHGTRKSTLARLISEDYGIPLIETDVVGCIDVRELHPIERQFLFANSALFGKLRAYRIAFEENSSVILDYSPYLVIPYTYYHLGKNAKGIDFIVNKIWNESEKIEKIFPDIETKYIILYVEESYDIIIRNIVKRGREKLVKEEARESYLKFINIKIQEISKELEKEGYVICYVRADQPIDNKIFEFVKCLEIKE